MRNNGRIVKGVWWQWEKDMESGKVCLFDWLIVLHQSDKLLKSRKAVSTLTDDL